MLIYVCIWDTKWRVIWDTNYILTHYSSWFEINTDIIFYDNQQNYFNYETVYLEFTNLFKMFLTVFIHELYNIDFSLIKAFNNLNYPTLFDTNSKKLVYLIFNLKRLKFLQNLQTYIVIPRLLDTIKTGCWLNQFNYYF